MFFLILRGIRWLRTQLKLNCFCETEGEAKEGSREEEERDLAGKRAGEGGENLEIAKDEKLNFKTVAYIILLIKLQMFLKCSEAKHCWETMSVCVYSIFSHCLFVGEILNYAYIILVVATVFESVWNISSQKDLMNNITVTIYLLVLISLLYFPL